MAERGKDTLRIQDWPAGASRPLVTPLQPSVVYASDTPDGLDAQYEGGRVGYTYSREGHPNAAVLSAQLNALEGVSHGAVFSSGMAAVSVTALALLSAGDHMIGGSQLYGRSMRLMKEELPRFGIDCSFADPVDVEEVAAAIRPETKMILLEVVSNPTLRVADVAGIAALARARGIKLAIDNTFTTPRGFQPMAEGADLVIHSVTKLLAGHSDVMLGYVGGNDPDAMAAIEGLGATLGTTASPYDCWMAERGLLTFDLRYDRATATAVRLAEALADAPGITRVVYPGRADHPDHNRAMGLLKGRAGNMVSFEIPGGRDAANRLTAAMPEIAFAPTLGDVSTTLSHPASSSHRALTEEARMALGMSQGFFRVSVGIEPVDQLIESFERGIAAAAQS